MAGTAQSQDLCARDWERWSPHGKLGTDIRLGPGGWLLGLEYLYYRFDGSDESNTQVLNLATGVPSSFGTCPTKTSACIGHVNGDFDVNTIKGRLSYKF